MRLIIRNAPIGAFRHTPFSPLIAPVTEVSVLSHANTRFARIYANSLAIASLVSHSLAKRKLARDPYKHKKINNKQRKKIELKLKKKYIKLKNT